jgi:hypothetical protein
MEIESTRYLSVQLRNGEIDAMRNMALLAQKQLAASPETPMYGGVLCRRAGLFGQELINTTSIIEKIIEATEYLNNQGATPCQKIALLR